MRIVIPNRSWPVPGLDNNGGEESLRLDCCKSGHKFSEALGIPRCARDDMRIVILNRCRSTLNLDDRIGEESLMRADKDS